MDILIQCFYTTFTMVHQYKPMPGYLWLAKSVYKCYSCSLGWCYRHISDFEQEADLLIFALSTPWLLRCTMRDT